MLLMELALLIKYYFEGKKRYILIPSILALVLSGGNHITAFAGILIGLAFFIFTLLKKKGRGSFIPLVIGIIGFIFNITSPGTAIRAQAFHHKGNIIDTIINTTFASFDRIDTWFTLSLALFIIILGFLLYDELKKIKVTLKQTALLSVISYIIFAGMMCVPYYAMGNYGSGRVTNTLYLTFFIMILVISMCIFSNLIKDINIPKKYITPIYIRNNLYINILRIWRKQLPINTQVYSSNRIWRIISI